MLDGFKPIDQNLLPSFDIEDFINPDLIKNQIHSAININESNIQFDEKKTTPYKILQEIKELKEKTKAILDSHNAELVKLARQVEELQKSNDSLSNLNKKYDKELKEAKKELKKTKKYNAVALAVAIISMLSAIIIPFIIK